MLARSWGALKSGARGIPSPYIARLKWSAIPLVIRVVIREINHCAQNKHIHASSVMDCARIRRRSCPAEPPAPRAAARAVQSPVPTAAAAAACVDSWGSVAATGADPAGALT